MTPPPPDETSAPTDAGAPDNPSEPATPGRGMLLARFALVALLSVGLLFFGVYAFNDLAKGMERQPAAVNADTLALDAEADPQPGGDFLQAQNADEALSAGFIPIEHDPAHLPPYPGAQRDVCHRRKPDGLFNDEHAVYTVDAAEATVEQVIAHYHAAAQRAGFTVQSTSAIQGQPGSNSMLLQRERDSLIVAVVPHNPAPPSVPTLSVAVQFRYPIASQP